MATRFEISTIFRAKDEFTAPVDSFAKKIKDFSTRAKTRMDFLNKSVLGVVASLAKAKTILFGLAAAGGLAVGKLIKPFIGFEKTVSLSASLLPESIKKGTAEYDKLFKTILDFSAREAFNPELVAKGFKDMAQATSSAEFAMKSLDKTALFARANSVDFDFAMKVLRTSLLDFGLITNDVNTDLATMEKVMDAITFTSQQANLGIEDIFQTMATAGPLMRDTNTSLNSFMTMINLLGQGGIKGPVAGTTLRNISAAFTNPNEEARKFMGMKKGGIQLTDTETGKQLPLTNLIAQFSESTRNLSSIDRATVAMKFFGRQSVTGAAVLVNHVEEMKKLVKETDELKNVTRDASTVLKLSLGFAMDKVNTQFNRFRINVGKAIAPNLVEFLDAVSGELDKNHESLEIFTSSLIKAGVFGANVLAGSLVGLFKIGEFLVGTFIELAKSIKQNIDSIGEFLNMLSGGELKKVVDNLGGLFGFGQSSTPEIMDFFNQNKTIEGQSALETAFLNRSKQDNVSEMVLRDETGRVEVEKSSPFIDLKIEYTGGVFN